MARIGLKGVLAGLGLLTLTGCMGARSSWMYPHGGTEGLAQTPDEHRNQVARVLEQDRRAIAEDLDLLFMTDRPTRLSKWHSR